MINFPNYIPKEFHKACIICHGYGSSGEDMAGLVPSLKSTMPQTAFFCPNGPTQLAWQSYEWFSLDDFTPSCLQNTEYLNILMDRLEPAREYLKKLIKEIQETYRLSVSDLFLAGFSQGGLSAIYTALTYPEAVQAMIGMSSVPILFNQKFPKTIVKQTPPILLTHGSADPVVPLKGLELNIQELRSIGINPHVYIEQGMEHGISENCIKEIQKFIKPFYTTNR